MTGQVLASKDSFTARLRTHVDHSQLWGLVNAASFLFIRHIEA